MQECGRSYAHTLKLPCSTRPGPHQPGLSQKQTESVGAHTCIPAPKEKGRRTTSSRASSVTESLRSAWAPQDPPSLEKQCIQCFDRISVQAKLWHIPFLISAHSNVEYSPGSTVKLSVSHYFTHPLTFSQVSRGCLHHHTDQSSPYTLKCFNSEHRRYC